MAGDLLKKELKDLKEKRILIVMDDGLSFLGKLIDFDSDTLILEDVYQAEAKQINWKNFEMKNVWGKPARLKEIGEKDEKDEEEKVGYVEWVEVDLDRLYIQIDHTVRIWYESELKEKEEPPAKSTVYSKK
ncbi:MAG: hypothetical protein V5A88_07155 [Candidatus Thermoplasmatota archaeon]